MQQEKYVNEIRKFAENFYKYIDFSLAKLIEHILSYTYLPTKSEIARDLGIPPYTLSRKLSFLKYKGFLFGLHIDHYLLGLQKLVIISKDFINLDDVPKKFLGFYAPILLPFRGTLLMYYVPVTLDINEILSKIPNVGNYDVLQESIYSKPKLTIHFNFVRRDLEVNWDHLLEVVKGGDYFRDIASIYRGHLIKERPKFDLLDLIIIKELEKDPFKPLKDVADESKVNYPRILRHFNVHVSKVVRGFRLRVVPLPPEHSLYVAVRVVDDFSTLVRLANALSELIFTAGVHLSYSNVMYAFLVSDMRNFNELLKFLSSVTRSYEIYLLDRSRRVAFTVPYPEYSKYLRSWVA